MSTPNDHTREAENDTRLDTIAAFQFCVIGESDPLLCHWHREWACNACPGGESQHPGRAHGSVNPPDGRSQP